MPDMPLQLKTGSYASWRPSEGVAVRVTVGRPKPQYFAPPYEELLTIAPWELFQGGRYLNLPEPEELRLYRHRLHTRRARLLKELAELADRIDGQAAVLLCYEDVHAGEICHRRWFADWAEEVWGWQIPEIPPASSRMPVQRDRTKKAPPAPEPPPCLF